MISNGDLDKINFRNDKISVAKVDFPNASKKVNDLNPCIFHQTVIS